MRIAFHGRYISALLILILLRAYPAHANGVHGTITNGETKNGSVTGTGHDEYTFTADRGSSFVAVAGETGIHDDNFVVGLERVAPGGKGRGTGKTYFARLVEQNAAEGTWTLKVIRADGGNTGGAYALTLVQLPGASGTAMSNGQTYDGSVERSGINVYTFTGVAGHGRALTLNRTGETGIVPEMSVYTPAGVLMSGVACYSGGCAQSVPVAANGTYSVLVSGYGESAAAGAYTLSVSDSN